MKNFVGSKAASGAAQQIISMLPAHDVFVETFAGRGAVSLLKRPARYTFLYEKDLKTAGELYLTVQRSGHFKDVYFNCTGDGFLPYPFGLPTLPTDCKCFVVSDDVFKRLPPYLGVDGGNVCVYCDPPYLKSARRDKSRDYYAHTWSDEEHVGFLEWVAAAKFPLMISGYDAAMYNEALPAWHTHTFSVPTRAGRALEKLWMNYNPGAAQLHDARFVGDSFTDRQRIKRKATRWVNRLAAMRAAERQVILEAIRDYVSSHSGS